MNRILRNARFANNRRSSSSIVSRLPDTEEDLFLPSDKVVAFVGDAKHGPIGFKKAHKLFPKSWGILWGSQSNSLSKTLVGYPKAKRVEIYEQIRESDLEELNHKLDDKDKTCLSKHLLTLGGEEGKLIVSEAFQYLGVPPIISYRSDLPFIDRKNCVPLGWIVKEQEAIFNIHPAPPEKRGGAGVFVPSIVNGEKEYGVTVHKINSKIDDGAIMFVERFAIPLGATYNELSWLTEVYTAKALEQLLLIMKYTDLTNSSEINTTCHHMWGVEHITKKDVRHIVKKLASKYGERGHPALCT